MRPARSILPALWMICAVLVFATDLVKPIGPPASDPAIADTHHVHVHSGWAISHAAAFLGFGFVYLLMDWAFRMTYRRSLGLIHLGLMFGGWMLIRAPMIILSSRPLREVDFALARPFAIWNAVSSVGYCLGLAGLVVFLVLMVDALAQVVRARSRRSAP